MEGTCISLQLPCKVFIPRGKRIQDGGETWLFGYFKFMPVNHDPPPDLGVLAPKSV